MELTRTRKQKHFPPTVSLQLPPYLQLKTSISISHRNSEASWLGGSGLVKLWFQSSFWPGLQSSEGLPGAGGSTSKMAHLRGWQVSAGCFSTYGHLHKDA